MDSNFRRLSTKNNILKGHGTWIRNKYFKEDYTHKHESNYILTKPLRTIRTTTY